MIPNGMDPRVARLRRSRLALYMAVDGLLIAASLVAAEGIYRALSGGAATRMLSVAMISTTVILVGTLLFARRAYSTHPRYFGRVDMFNLGGIWFFGCLWVVVFGAAAGGAATPAGWAFPLLFMLISLPALMLPRLARMLYHQRFRRLTARTSPEIEVRRTLVVGAGDAGETVTRESKRCVPPVRRIVGLIDDDPNKVGTYVHGVKVLGAVPTIPDWCQKLGVNEVLIAIPSASGEQIRRIASIASSREVSVQTLPPIMQLDHGGRGLAHQFREVKIEDLLGREPVTINSEALEASLEGSTVLITGAGGSIGSELARNIARMKPKRLILLGRGENSIFEIEQELVQLYGVRPTCIITDIRNRVALEEVFDVYRPDLVLHAAAHKHVPLMEAAPIEAVENNVFGTRNIAQLAVQYLARKFVYVSTDKAVYPSGVMGATKRICEMLIGAIAEQGDTSFTIVRFGNVLGSRGSVIPMMEKQILRGGPVRVTHPDMTRFFMTIPEAAKLILQSSEFGGRCDIFMLDMGEPVRILSLAEDLIEQHGLKPSIDIEIRFTGPRPGEKLCEELSYKTEELSPTQHPKIFSLRAPPTRGPIELFAELERLERVCAARDEPSVRELLVTLTSPPAYALAGAESPDGIKHSKRFQQLPSIS